MGSKKDWRVNFVAGGETAKLIRGVPKNNKLSGHTHKTKKINKYYLEFEGDSFGLRASSRVVVPIEIYRTKKTIDISPDVFWHTGGSHGFPRRFGNKTKKMVEYVAKKEAELNSPFEKIGGKFNLLFEGRGLDSPTGARTFEYFCSTGTDAPNSNTTNKDPYKSRNRGMITRRSNGKYHQ